MIKATNSLLITGGNSQAREEEAFSISQENSSKFDTMIIDTLVAKGIEIIREILPQVFRKPFQSTKTTVIILEADKLTMEAQNSLLKILEEPPEHCQLILTSQSKNNLLSTVASRCLELALQKEPSNNALNTQEFLALSFDEQLSWIEKNDLSDYLNIWYEKLHETLKENGQMGNLKWLWGYNKLIVKLSKAQKAYVNKKLLSLVLALELPQTQKQQM